MGIHCRLSAARHHTGFTLIEVLITAALLTTVSAGAMTLLMMSMDFERQAWAQSRCKDEGYSMVEHLTREVREAVMVSIEGYRGERLVVERRDKTFVAYEAVYDRGAAQTFPVNTLYFYPDVEHSEKRVLLGRNISQINGEPFFSRDQNIIFITFRVGDVYGFEGVDASGASNTQGIDVRTVAVLRKGS